MVNVASGGSVMDVAMQADAYQLSGRPMVYRPPALSWGRPLAPRP